MEKINLDLDDENEITFRVQIEGTRPGEPMCRLMIENSGVNFALNGEFLENDEVSIVIPPMKSMLKEGTYSSYLEVIVDDKVFMPLDLEIDFEKSVKVVAESVSRKRKQKTNASASVVSTTKKKSSVAVVENSAQTPRKESKTQTPETRSLSESDILSLVREIRMGKNKKGK